MIVLEKNFNNISKRTNYVESIYIIVYKLLNKQI